MKLHVKEKHKRNAEYLLGSVLVIAFLIRIIHGLSYGFSNDELSALARIRYSTLNEIINKGVAVDFHPALVQVFLYYWTKLFGTSLLAVRLPFILAGTASVWVTYKAGITWFNSTSGAIAGVFIAFLGYTIIYSEIARPYAFGMLFSALTLYYWGLIFIRKKQSWQNFILLGLWVLLSMYTHYYSFFVSGLMYAFGIFFLNRSSFKKYIIAALFIILLYLPFLPVFMEQVGRGGIGGPDGWLGKPTSDWLWLYTQYVFNNSYLLILIVAFGIAISTLSIFKIHFYKALLLPFWFFISFLFGYLYSHHVNPVLQFSVLIFCFPGLILFIAYGLTSFNKILTPFLTVLLIGLLVFATTDRSGFFKKQLFSQFEQPTNDFKEWTTETPQLQTFSIIDVFDPYYFNYYLNESDPKPNAYLLDNPESWNSFISALIDPDIEYLIYGWSAKKPYPEIYTAIKQSFPYTLDDRFYFNSRMTLYARNNQDKLDFIPENTYFSNSKSIENAEQNMKPTMEYGANLNLENIILPDSVPLKIEAKVALSSADSLGGVLVIDAMFDDDQKIWRGKNLSLFKNSDSVYFAYTTLEIPNNTKEIINLKVYIWNNKKENFKVLNVQVQIKEHLNRYVLDTYYLK